MKTGVAILGIGTVGGAVAQMLVKENEHLEKRSGQSLVLRHVLEREIEPHLGKFKDPSILTTQPERIFSDPQTQIVVELIGGIEPARSLILKAIKAGKHIVTANKHLLARHGVEIFQAARKAGVSVSFEASCGGAIPIIMALTRGLIANDITRVVGIVNGTCNYILSQMTLSGQSYADALRSAQQAGFAEADPTMDVSGMDSAHKLAILASIAFGVQVPLEKIDVTGINDIKDDDLRYGKELGYICKLLAIGEKSDAGISLRVHPTFVPSAHLLASVSGSFNAISVIGHAAGQTIYYGRGAGGRPTSSAVLADIIDVAMGTAPILFNQLPVLTRRKTADLLPIKNVVSRHYLRMTALDEPGVMHQITGVLGRNGISLSAVVQHESRSGEYVPLVVTTHEARDGAVTKAVEQIDKLKCVKGATSRIRVLDPAG
ncbi:MAG TPA: homoserine dehydrogenase [Phycisphaerae bacterium]|nr:homoserine dehydrogenase [Phycisphaerae bacterium]